MENMCNMEYWEPEQELERENVISLIEFMKERRKK